MQQPLVSILIPFKNTEKYFQECLQSILDQSYTNWEVIAVNDHSTDKSKKIASFFSGLDSRIQVFDSIDHGIISALRLAFEKSKGYLITRMDSDDIMARNKLNILSKTLIKNGTGHVALGQVCYFADEGLGNGYKRYAQWLNGLTSTGTNYAELYKECVIPSPCWMVYRKDLITCGAFTPDRYPEDYDLAFRFYEQQLKCIPCNSVLHHWRDYNTRTSRTSAHYAQNYFIEIKLHYFLKLNKKPNSPLVVWGAGTKGKLTAKLLQNKKVDFLWVCDNSNKIGKDIYQKRLQHFSEIQKLINPQTIITVANPNEQRTISSFLMQNNQIHMEDYYFFC